MWPIQMSSRIVPVYGYICDYIWLYMTIYTLKYVFWVSGLVFWVSGLVFWVSGLVFWVSGLVFWVSVYL